MAPVGKSPPPADVSKLARLIAKAMRHGKPKASIATSAAASATAKAHGRAVPEAPAKTASVTAKKPALNTLTDGARTHAVPVAALDPLLVSCRPQVSLPLTLKDGRKVELRNQRPEDSGKFVAFLETLSPSTWMMRDIGRNSTTRKMFKDPPKNHLPLVVADGDRIAAVARYLKCADGGKTADVALTVNDAYQGNHLGPALLRQLAEAASQDGVTTFTADVLFDNHRVLKILEHFGFEKSIRDGMWHLSVPVQKMRDLVAAGA